jgi:biopolymer transport protein ExbB/TolQ
MPSPAPRPAPSDATGHEAPRLAYATTFGLLAVALFFPVALMVFNPTLMFERGWEQYVGTSLYVWAVVTLGRELLRLKGDESAFAEASKLLKDPTKIAASDRRVLPSRLRGLATSAGAPVEQLMELSREASGLDQEEAAGRFTLTKYILYLLPVIGFIGTVEGISKALMNISLVLPMVKNLDGFMSNLTGVTSALQIAFDSTLLALFLSAALMFVQTLVHRRSDDLLARVDRWVVAHALSGLGSAHTNDAALAEIARKLDELGERLGVGIGPHVDRFADSVQALPRALAGLHRGADAIERLGEGLSSVGGTSDVVRKGVASLGRIEAIMAEPAEPSPQLDAIRLGVERTSAAIEGLSSSWSSSFERSSRASQEQLARTLTSLKDAIELLQVSMEQGNTLYRTIVKKLFNDPKSGFSVTTEDAA